MCIQVNSAHISRFFFSPPHRRRRRSFVLFHKITKQSSLSPPLIRLPFSLLLLFCFSNRNCGRHRGDPFFIQFPSLDFSSSRRLSPPSIHLSTVIRDTHTHKLGSVFIPFRLFSHWNTRNEIEIACWSSFLFSNKKKKGSSKTRGIDSNFFQTVSIAYSLSDLKTIRCIDGDRSM